MADRLTVHELRRKIIEKGDISAVIDSVRADQMPTESLRAAWMTLIDARLVYDSARRAVDVLLSEGE